MEMFKLRATWSLYIKWFLVILVVLLVLVLFVPDKPKDYLILISAVVFLMGVTITQWIKLYSETIDRAFSLLLQSNENEELRKNIQVIKSYISSNAVIPRQNFIDLCTSKISKDKEILQSILDVADYFEQMAIAIKYEQVNEILLRDFYIGIYVRFYRSIKHLLPLVRNDPPEPYSAFGKAARPEAYDNLDWLYNRWSIEYIKMLKK